MVLFIVGIIPGEFERLGIFEFGYLDSGYPELFIGFPFSIPPIPQFQNFGLAMDVKAISEISVIVSNNADPVSLSFYFEDDRANPFQITYDRESNSEVWLAQRYFNKRFLKTAGYTEEQRLYFEENNPPKNIESTVDISLKTLFIEHGRLLRSG